MTSTAGRLRRSRTSLPTPPPSPVADGLSIKVTGAQQLARLSQNFKDTGNKTLQRSTRKRLRHAVEPVVREIRAAAAVNSQHVAATIQPTFRYSKNSAAAGIKANRRRMPAGKENLPSLFEFGSQGSGGRFIRHPVFGSKVRVNQPIRPYFYRNANDSAPRVQHELVKVLDDVEKELT